MQKLRNDFVSTSDQNVAKFTSKKNPMFWSESAQKIAIAWRRTRSSSQSRSEGKSKLMTIRQSFQNHKNYLTRSMHGATQYGKLESHPKYLLLKLVMYILEHGLAGYCRDI